MEGLIDASLDGLPLAEAEQQKLEAHRSACVACDTYLRQMHAVLDALTDLPPVTTPPDLTERIMQRVQEQPATLKRRSWVPLGVAAAVAAILIAAPLWGTWERSFQTGGGTLASSSPSEREPVQATPSTKSTKTPGAQEPPARVTPQASPPSKPPSRKVIAEEIEAESGASSDLLIAFLPLEEEGPMSDEALLVFEPYDADPMSSLVGF
jgi:hypothetical protein